MVTSRTANKVLAMALSGTVNFTFGRGFLVSPRSLCSYVDPEVNLAQGSFLPSDVTYKSAGEFFTPHRLASGLSGYYTRECH